jgi:hypothetical protein
MEPSSSIKDEELVTKYGVCVCVCGECGSICLAINVTNSHNSCLKKYL